MKEKQRTVLESGLEETGFSKKLIAQETAGVLFRFVSPFVVVITLETLGLKEARCLYCFAPIMGLISVSQYIGRKGGEGAN